MKTIFLILLIILSANVFSQELECEKYKNGTFIIKENNFSKETIIIRNENFQVEKMEGMKDSSVFIVNWINSCTYTLTPTKMTLKLKRFRNLPKNAMLIVEIIETKEKSYIVKSKSNFANLEVSTEMYKIK